MQQAKTMKRGRWLAMRAMCSWVAVDACSLDTHGSACQQPDAPTLQIAHLLILLPLQSKSTTRLPFHWDNTTLTLALWLHDSSGSRHEYLQKPSHILWTSRLNNRDSRCCSLWLSSSERTPPEYSTHWWNSRFLFLSWRYDRSG